MKRMTKRELRTHLVALRHIEGLLINMAEDFRTVGHSDTRLDEDGDVWNDYLNVSSELDGLLDYTQDAAYYLSRLIEPSNHKAQVELWNGGPVE